MITQIQDRQILRFQTAEDYIGKSLDDLISAIRDSVSSEYDEDRTMAQADIIIIIISRFQQL